MQMNDWWRHTLKPILYQTNRQTDRQTNYFNMVFVRLKRISFQESRAKKLLKTIQLQIFMIYHVYKWAISVNLQHRPLVLGRLLVLQETHLWPTAVKQLCFHGNSLFSSPHPLDFDILVIFSSKNINRGRELELTYL